jgi:MYXO-CTERM domain-containing protein
MHAAAYRFLSILALGTLGVALPRAGFAQQMLGQVVTEPNNWPVPQPASSAEVGCCVTGRGYPASAAELSGVFAWNNDPTVDWIKDAKSGPGTFSPLCGFQGKLLLRGGACKLDFGWYNVTGTAPTDKEIYTIIPKTDPDIYGSMGQNDFCPLVGVSTQPGEVMRCTLAAQKAFSATDIRNDKNYKGGLIGFALRGDKNSTCTETHYSQNELHAKSGNSSWIMSLLYESKAFPDAYYLAFEDRAASQFGPNSQTDNDGDFNDFVFFISGVTCDGGGQACDASIQHPELKGACTAGRTGCAPLGMTQDRECVPVVTPNPERCDNIDNDCDGLVDNGKDLCEAGKVCDKGTCVSACNTGEFACSTPLVCNTAGYCVDPACKEIDCKDGQVCRNGMCIGGCDGAVCPLGQECQLGHCVDLCASVKCGEDQVCEKGACIGSCSCRGCGTGRECAMSGPTKGHCVDSGCEDQTCGAGQLCTAGNCVDACQGAVCPGGASCATGQCGEPLPGSEPPPPGGNSGGNISIGNGGSISIGNGGSNAGGTPTGSSGTGTGAGARQNGNTGCGCRVAPVRDARVPLLLAASLLGLLARRRARQRSARS